jgi:hypothetical protein
MGPSIRSFAFARAAHDDRGEGQGGQEALGTAGYEDGATTVVHTDMVSDDGERARTTNRDPPRIGIATSESPGLVERGFAIWMQRGRRPRAAGCGPKLATL